MGHTQGLQITWLKTTSLYTVQLGNILSLITV